MTGTADTCLVIIRGNSATGKSSVSREIRARVGPGVAWVSQDVLRRDVLGERDRPGAANVGLIDLTARYALDRGFHVVLDGILHPPHYGEMLVGLVADHLGRSHAYWLDADFDETVRRHASKPEADLYGPAQMRSWFNPMNLVPGLGEHVIGQESSLDHTVTRILTDTGLG